MKILQVGCGNMGQAVLSKIHKAHTVPTNLSITVVDQYINEAFSDQHSSITFCTEQEHIGDTQFDMVIIALKPQLIGEVMPSYGRFLKEGGQVVSMAAGFDLKGLREIFPTSALVRMMPNMPVNIGKGIVGLVFDDTSPEGDKRRIHQLLAGCGKIIEVENEDFLDRFTAIAGSGPGYIFQFMHDYSLAAQALGFSKEDASALVLQTVQGAAGLAATEQASFEELRNRITSKKGTTEAGLSAMQENNLSTKMMQTVLANAYGRAQELSR